jgi:hypothetical protein
VFGVQKPRCALFFFFFFFFLQFDPRVGKSAHPSPAQPSTLFTHMVIVVYITERTRMCTTLSPSLHTRMLLPGTFRQILLTTKMVNTVSSPSLTSLTFLLIQTVDTIIHTASSCFLLTRTLYILLRTNR